MASIIKIYNSKTWYRLLKVIFILFFITVLGVINGYIFRGGLRRLDIEKSYIQCLQGENKIIPYLGFLDSIDITSRCYNYVIKDVVIDIDRDVYFYNPPKSLADKIDFIKFNNNINRGLKPELVLNLERPLYKVDLVYSYTEAIKQLILVNLMLLAFFEIVRRSYYYVVFGKIRP